MPDVLTSRAFKSSNGLSRYSNFPYYYHTVDNKFIYGFSDRINENISYVMHTVKNGESLDSIALYYYNNPTYYWMLCDFNHFDDPFIDLKEGQRIKIPTFSAITFDK